MIRWVRTSIFSDCWRDRTLRKKFGVFMAMSLKNPAQSYQSICQLPKPHFGEIRVLETLRSLQRGMVTVVRTRMSATFCITVLPLKTTSSLTRNEGIRPNHLSSIRSLARAFSRLEAPKRNQMGLSYSTTMMRTRQL